MMVTCGLVQEEMVVRLTSHPQRGKLSEQGKKDIGRGKLCVCSIYDSGCRLLLSIYTI